MEFLKQVWEGWKKVVLFVGDIIGRTILTLFYFTVFVPFGGLQTLFGDRLDTKNKDRIPTWSERKTTDLTLEDARRLG